MDILDKEKFIFGGLFLIANKLQAVGDQYLSKDDMTTKQWFLTALISQFHDTPPTLSEVAEIMGSSRQNVKQLALKLERKDFLSIQKDEEDARALRLKLTEKSNLFWTKREGQDNRFISDLFKEFTEDEIDIMHRGLAKLIDKIAKMGKASDMPLNSNE